MKKNLLVLTIAFLIGSPAFAASWNMVLSDGPDVIFYFDSETVVQKDGITSLWMKGVQKEKADKDGNWASAFEWRINCVKNSASLLTISTYDQNNDFKENVKLQIPEKVITENSNFWSLLQMVCAPNFPHATSGPDYISIKGNDIFLFTKFVVRADKNLQDPAPR